MMTDQTEVLVSGGFDPLHTGHISMMEEASDLGDRLIVLVNNHHWLIEKKGYCLIPDRERVELIQAYPFVDQVRLTGHDSQSAKNDRSICKDLRKISPDVFANGGDRVPENIPEYDICKQLGIRLEFGVGKEKTHSSTSLFWDAVAQYADHQT